MNGHQATGRTIGKHVASAIYYWQRHESIKTSPWITH